MERSKTENREREFLIATLLNKRKEKELEMEEERKNVQDAIMELKLEYSEKLRKINYDMVLNCVSKYEDESETKQ